MMKHALTLAAFALLTISYPAHAGDEEQWLSYTPENRILTTRIPFGYQTKTGTFVQDENTTLHFEEIVGHFINDEHPGLTKTFAVKYSHALGMPISQIEAQTMLEQEMNTIEQAYSAHNGKTLSRYLGMLDNKPYNEIIVEYEHNKHGKQAIRSRTIFTPNLNVKLMALGPTDHMTALKTNDFFDTFELRKVSTNQQNDLTKEWRSIEAPHKTYSLFVPQQSEFFMPGEPKTQRGKNFDRMGLVFTDPVREQFMFYNVLTYYAPQNATFQDVQSLLRARHINTRQQKQSSVPFKENIIDNTAFLQTSYEIPEIEGYPYARNVRLRTRFRGHHIVVQELVGSNELITSEFADKIMDSLLFQPENSTISVN